MEFQIYKAELKLTSVDFDRKIYWQKITSSFVAFEIGLEIIKLEDFQVQMQEYFFVVGLNHGNRTISYMLVSIGGMTGAVVDGKNLFKHLLLANCTSYIIYHNHPSGRTFPSEPDKRLTKELKEFGDLIDIKLLDHIIIGAEPSFSEEAIGDKLSYSYYSFADNDLI